MKYVKVYETENEFIEKEKKVPISKLVARADNGNGEYPLADLLRTINDVTQETLSGKTYLTWSMGETSDIVDPITLAGGVFKGSWNTQTRDVMLHWYWYDYLGVSVDWAHPTTGLYGYDEEYETLRVYPIDIEGVTGTPLYVGINPQPGINRDEWTNTSHPYNGVVYSFNDGTNKLVDENIRVMLYESYITGDTYATTTEIPGVSYVPETDNVAYNPQIMIANLYSVDLRGDVRDGALSKKSYPLDSSFSAMMADVFSFVEGFTEDVDESYTAFVNGVPVATCNPDSQEFEDEFQAVYDFENGRINEDLIGKDVTIYVRISKLY